MSRRAGLHPDQARRQPAEEPLHLAAPQRLAQDDLSTPVHRVQLENVLCDIKADRGNLRHDNALICNPDFETRLKILYTASPERYQALGRNIVALINTYFIQNAASHSSAFFVGFPVEKQQTGSKLLTTDQLKPPWKSDGPLGQAANYF